MYFKTLTTFCVIVAVAKSSVAQFLGTSCGLAGNSLGYAGLGNGLGCAAGNGLGYAGLAGNGLGCAAGNGLGFAGIGYGGLAGAGLGYGVASTGGSLPVASASPIAPVGVSVVSENAYEGALSVGGNLPFLGTIGLEGVLPTFGAGAVSYGCGNGICDIAVEEGAATGIAGPASIVGIGPYGNGIGAFGPGIAGFGAYGLGAAGIDGFCPNAGLGSYGAGIAGFNAGYGPYGLSGCGAIY